MDITADQRPLPPCFTVTCVANGWIVAPAAGNFAIYELKDAHVFLDELGVKMHITAARERWLHDCAQFDAPKDGHHLESYEA
jgi:hypothetical protein